MSHVPRATLLEDQAGVPRQRSAATRLTLLICAGILFFCFIALGTWQVKRLQWKLDLIEQVQQRVHALPVAAPVQAQWSQVSAATDAYRHVRVSGTFLNERTTAVQAVTELGTGFWLLTPLCSVDGSTVLVNRGFVPNLTDQPPQSVSAGCSAVDSTSSELSVVTGLLRVSEPGGAFLRNNDPVHQRWFSRDVQAIAAEKRLVNTAPYFIDADATPGVSAALATAPVGGLTVISFQNNHLVYAFTWYGLALMVAGACFWVTREERRYHAGHENDDASKK